MSTVDVDAAYPFGGVFDTLNASVSSVQTLTVYDWTITVIVYGPLGFAGTARGAVVVQ